jgi:hypothetical protein
MKTFVNDDTGYIAWIAVHPEGFVLNAPRTGRQLPALHRASCAFISNPARANYTTTSYYKVCSVVRDDLVAWVAERSAALKVCSVCLRDSALPSTAVAPEHGRRAARASEARSGTPPSASAALAVHVVQAPVDLWQLWAPGTVLQTLDGVRPLLASWNANSDPAQIRLRAYLQDLSHAFGPLLENRDHLFLHRDVDVEQPERLLRHYDLENYLTPVAHHLGADRFVLASARKRVGGGSRIQVGLAVPTPAPSADASWAHFGLRTERGAGGKAWQAAVRAALVTAAPTPAPRGPVEVRIAWRCGPQRNWVALWKPTGDVMGPVLGEPYPQRPFYPNDDRIVTLGLHRTVDLTRGLGVDVGLWWRPAVGV